MTQRRPEDLVSLFGDEADDVCSPDVLRSRVTDVRRAGLRPSPALNRRAPRRWALVVGAAVVVAAVSIGVSLLGGPNSGDRPGANGKAAVPKTGANRGTQAPVNDPLLPPYPAHPAAATRRQIIQLLDKFPTLPGAHHRGSDPTGQLGSPSSQPATGDLVEVHRWWVAPGTMAAALAFVRSHVPAGFKSSGNGSSGNRGGLISDSLEFSAGLPRSSFTDSPADVQFQVTRHGSGIAVRVDVLAIWLPRRSTAEQIIDPTSVAITTWTGTPATHRRQHTFGAKVAAQLATVVNGLPTMVPHVELGCPAESGRPHPDLLTFATSTATLRLNVTTFCEQSVAIKADGRAQPVLDASSGKLQSATAAAMKNH